MLPKKVHTLWLVVTLIAGISLGYVFNTQFCRMTIEKRVDKEIGLNQNLRAYWVDLTWWLHTYFIFLPTKSAPVSMLPQIHATIESIAELLGKFYGNGAREALDAYAKAQVVQLVDLQDAVNDGHKEQVMEITKALKNEATAIAKTLHGLNPYIVTRTLENLLHEYIDLYREDFLSHKEKRDSVQILVDMVTKARQIADLLDDSITKQFPQRF